MDNDNKRTEPLMETRLWKAAEQGDCKTLRILAMGGADFNIRNDDGFTPFNIATQNGHSDAAMTILAAREMQFARLLGEDPVTFFTTNEAPRKSA